MYSPDIELSLVILDNPLRPAHKPPTANASTSCAINYVLGNHTDIHTLFTHSHPLVLVHACSQARR